MSNYNGPAPLARSPITLAATTRARHNRPVHPGRAPGSVSLADLSITAKVAVRATESGPMAKALGTRFGRATREGEWLVIGAGPDEWLVIGPTADGPRIQDWLTGLAASDPDPVSVIDVTHGRALVRLTGISAPDVLAKLCAVDLADELVPDGGALRTSVAKLVTDIVRDDSDGHRSYLIHCERSSGQYLWDSLVDAGLEFGIEDLLTAG